MAVGRKPKPTALKELEGNPGKRKLNRSEPSRKRASRLVPNGFCRKQRRNGSGWLKISVSWVC